MARSEEQSARSTTESLNECHDPVESPETELDVSPTSTQNEQDAAAANVERGRPTRRDSDHGGSSGMNGASSSVQQSQRRDSSRSPDRVPTHRERTAAQPDSHRNPRAERSNLDTEASTSPQSVDTISAQHDNHNDPDPDPHRRQGFRRGDLVLDFFLPHTCARVEDAPIYRVTVWDVEASGYRLLLHRDLTGRAPLFAVRNWGQIRLADMQDDEWKDLESGGEWLQGQVMANGLKETPSWVGMVLACTMRWELTLPSSDYSEDEKAIWKLHFDSGEQ